MTEETGNVIRLRASPPCADCGSEKTVSRRETEEFDYRHGGEVVLLTADVTVHSCQTCGFQFLDSSSEDARNDAVCRFLGVLTPAEVKAVRVQYDLSRREMSVVSKIGEASLARWESGALIQTAAYDNYLYLLGYTDNLQRIRRRHGVQATANQAGSSRNWRSLDVTDRVYKQSREFSLRATARA